MTICDSTIQLERRMRTSEIPDGLSKAAREFVIRKHKLLIEGRWVDSAAGRTFQTIDPATESVICEVAEGDADDIDRAVQSARKAFEGSEWTRMRPPTASDCF
jgi:hypothetical protein